MSALAMMEKEQLEGKLTVNVTVQPTSDAECDCGHVLKVASIDGMLASRDPTDVGGGVHSTSLMRTESLGEPEAAVTAVFTPGVGGLRS